MAQTYDVKIWAIRENRGAKRTTYTVRWMVAGKEFPETFPTKGLAQSFLADLRKAAKSGEAFDTVTGLPVSMAREQNKTTWVEHSIRFADMKWPSLAATSRTIHASCLAHIALHLATTERGRPEAEEISRALKSWSYNSRARGAVPANDKAAARTVPAGDEREAVLKWVSAHSIPVVRLADAAVVRAVLLGLQRNLDGTKSSATAYDRRRGVFFGALEYAVELDLLDSNPMQRVKVTRVKSLDEQVDPATVASLAQGRTLIEVAKNYNSRYKGRLAAFFGLMFWAGLRPAECVDLHVADLTLPAEGWGEARLKSSDPQPGKEWLDEDAKDGAKSLKHRADGAIRVVPLDPELVALLLWHLATWPPNETGRVFTGPHARSTRVPKQQYLRVFHEVRALAELPDRVAVRPYDLRHACVSRQLAAGVPGTDVAAWAGHSLAVLNKTYAKVIDGQKPVLLARMDAAKREADAAEAA
jgi:integrase